MILKCYCVDFIYNYAMCVSLSIHTHAGSQSNGKRTFTRSMFGTHKAFHAFHETHFLCVYKRIRLGHPRFDKGATPERRKCAGTFLYKMLYSKIQWSKLYPYRRFSGHGRHFKFFQSFRYAVFVSFWNGLEFVPRGLQDDKRVLEDVKNEKNPSSDWFNLSPLLKRFRNNAPSLAIVC